MSYLYENYYNKKSMDKKIDTKKKNNTTKKKIKVLVLADNPENIYSELALPYKNDQNKTEYKGFLLDMFREITKTLEVKYEFEFNYTDKINYDKAVEEINKKKYDIAIGGFSMNGQRAELVNYTYPLYLNNNCILHTKKSAYFRNLITTIKKVSVPVIVLIILGVITGFIVNYYEPNRSSAIVSNLVDKPNDNPLLRRHILTGIAAFFGEMGFMAENSDLTTPGMIVCVIIFIAVFLVIMIVQAKLTTLEIEMQEDGQAIQIDRLPQYLFLGLEGHNSSKKLKKKGAIIKFLPEAKDINSLVNKYLQKEKEYDGIVTSYTKAYNFVKRNRNLVITYLGLGKEPQCFIINKKEIELTNDINEEIMKMRDNGLIAKLCKDFIPDKLDACLE